MRFKGKATVLTAVALCAAGCAHSDFPLSRSAQARWRPVDDRAVVEAKEEVPPKILPETYFAAAQLHEKQGQVLQAVEQYRKAIAVNHEYVAAYDRLGLLLGKVGLNAEATKALRTAAELAPDNAAVHNNLGFQLVLNGDWEGAEREFDRALDIFPGFARARINRGVVMGKTQRFAEALADFKAVLPESDAHYNLGIIYRTQQKYEQAAGEFRATLAADSSFVAAQRQLDQIAPKLAATPPAPSTAAVTFITKDGDRATTPTSATTRPALTAEALRPVEPPASTPVQVPPSTAVKPRATPKAAPVSRVDRPIEMKPIEEPRSRQTTAAGETTASPFEVPEKWAEPIVGDDADVDIYDDIASLPPTREQPCEETLIIDQPTDSSPAIDYSIVDGRVIMPPQQEIIGQAVLLEEGPVTKTSRRPTAAASIIEPTRSATIVTPSRPGITRNDGATTHELETELEIVRQEIDCLTHEAIEQERASDTFRHQPSDVTVRDVGTRPRVNASVPADEVILPMRLIDEPQTSNVRIDEPVSEKPVLTGKAWATPAERAHVGASRTRTTEEILPMRLIDDESEPSFDELNSRASIVDNEVRCLESRQFNASTDEASFSHATEDGDPLPFLAFDDMVELVTNQSVSMDADPAFSEATVEESISSIAPVQPITEPELLPMYEVIED